MSSLSRVLASVTVTTAMCCMPQRLPAAQPASPPNKDTPGTSVPASMALDFRAAKAAARLLAKSNRIKDAEDELVRSNKFQPNTPEWHLETSQKLVDTARELAREGATDPVSALANQSLMHLDRVAALMADARTKGQAKAAAALIHERLLGDTPAAIASYQAALALDPNDAGSREALEHLKAADANLRAKIRQAKK